MHAVLVTRPRQASEDFAERLRRAGFETYVVPLADYKPVDAALDHVEDYQALVFTSTRSVQAFSETCTTRHIPIFCVGNMTTAAAKKLGFQTVINGGGDVHNLSEIMRIKKEALHLEKVLHISGEDIAEDLAILLSPHGIKADRTILYRAELTETLPDETITALQAGSITTVTFFSARAAAQFSLLAKRYRLTKSLSALEAVCISPRVAHALKGLNFRALHVAEIPNSDGIMTLLESQKTDQIATQIPALPAADVIDAFGGLRPLANALHITASTVQGWKKRGMIPKTRTAEVLDAAQAARIDLGFLKMKGSPGMSDENDTPKAGDTTAESLRVPSDRRRNTDRRQKRIPPDAKGQIRAGSYNGADRRQQKDRRAYTERQQQRVRQEKWRFMNRSVIMTAFIAIAILYGGALLMAPEFLEVRQSADRLRSMEEQMKMIDQRLVNMQETQSSSFSGAINRKIEQFEAMTSGVTHSTEKFIDTAGSVAQSSAVFQRVEHLVVMLGSLTQLNTTAAGRIAVNNMMQTLKNALSASNANEGSLEVATDAARQQDQTLAILTKDIQREDLGAAALLLVLNELRGNLNTQQSFESDLKLVQKFTENDPAMQQALMQLAPYAENGVLSRETLQQEFKALASEIVMAKLQGEDLSVQEKVLKRLEKMMSLRRVDDVEGKTVDAVVARAQLKLDKGDVDGALVELQSLQGAPASVAKPWMNKAAGHVLADDTSSMITQMIIQQISGVGGTSIKGAVSDVLRQINTIANPAPGNGVISPPKTILDNPFSP